MIASAFNVCSAVSSCNFVFAGIRSLLFANTRLRKLYFGGSFRKYRPSFVTSVSTWPFDV